MFFRKRKLNEDAPEIKEREKDTDEPQIDDAAERFSGRTAAIFQRMYRMILSVNLQANVCQIEMGDRNLCGDILPQRMRYNAFTDYIAKNLHPDDRQLFADDFAPMALSAALGGAAGAHSRVYMMANEARGAADSEQGLSCSYYEFRAELIPDSAKIKTRCMIYIKELSERPEELQAPQRAETLRLGSDNLAINWNEIRAKKFFGEDVIYFEYNVAEDILYMHSPDNDGRLRIIKNYMRSIDARSDWSIFHGDMKKVKDAIELAKKGRESSFEMRYRPNGRKSAGLRYHSVFLAPSDEKIPPEWIIGGLRDVDEELRAKKSAKDIADHVEDMMSSMFTDMFELDVDNDLMYRIVKSEYGFERSADRVVLSQYVNQTIESGIIAAEYASEYKKWISKSYLEHKTLGKKYEFESRMRLPGSSEYRWYSETLTKLDGGRRFLRFRRDITEIQEMRRRDYEIAEASRYVEYNRKMLDTMASLVEFRNVESGMHIVHVRTLTRMLLEDLAARSPLYEISKRQIDLYSEAATMHDIGKIVVPDYILNKPGKLSSEEYEIMKRHTVDGARIVDKLYLPGQDELMDCCRDVALHHHERYDGSGYPDGLVGDQNSICVQAVGLADACDAMISVRCYKNGVDPEEAINMILNGECGAFNPRLLESFRHCGAKMLELYRQKETDV